MQKTILIARNRTTGKDEILAGSETDFVDQREAYLQFDSAIHEKYSEVCLFNLVPAKKPLRFITEAESDRRADVHEERLAFASKPKETNPSKARQALTDAEAAQKSAVEKYQAAKRAFGICQEAAQKLGLKAKLDAAKQAARQSITGLETARQEYHRSLSAPVVAAPIPAETKKPEPTAGERREAELLALSRTDLLALVETFKSEGKAVDTGGKSKKSDLVNAILKVEGFTITAPETAE